MSYRVQFTISDAEKAKLLVEATTEGYPNIAELCKARALQIKSSYGELYKIAVKKIAMMPSGTKFRLRDLIDNPPTLLGRWLFDNVANGNIPDVVYLNKKDADAAEYEKL